MRFASEDAYNEYHEEQFHDLKSQISEWLKKQHPELASWGIDIIEPEEDLDPGTLCDITTE